MTNKLVRPLRKKYTPGIPSTPGTPERCYKKSIRVDAPPDERTKFLRSVWENLPPAEYVAGFFTPGNPTPLAGGGTPTPLAGGGTPTPLFSPAGTRSSLSGRSGVTVTPTPLAGGGTPTPLFSPAGAQSILGSRSGVTASFFGPGSPTPLAAGGTPTPLGGGTYSGTLLQGMTVPAYRQVEPYIDDFGNLITQEFSGTSTLRFRPSPQSPNNARYNIQSVTVCEPAVEGTPGTPAVVEEQGSGPDWKASARSIERVSGDVVATFDVNPEGAVQAGFSVRDTGASQSDIRMGVLISKAGTDPTVYLILDGVTQQSLSTWFPGDKIELARYRGRFSVTVGGEAKYSGPATTSEPVYLDAMLYTANDFVDNPTLEAAKSLSVAGSVGFGDSVPLAIARSLSVAGSVGVSVSYDQVGTGGSELALRPIAMLASDYEGAGIALSLPSLVIEADGGLSSMQISGSQLVMAPPVMSGLMQTGGLITSQLSLPGMSMLAADRVYAEVVATMPRLLMYADDLFGGKDLYGHNENLELGSFIATDPTLFASIYETLELEPSLSLAALVSGTVLEGLILDPSLTAADFLSALIESGINLSSATQMPDPALAQYAFNALTGAATRYSDFGFTQFARAGGVTYAVKPDGLYKLRPGDDNGETRSALVDFGSMAFGVQQRKNIETLYLGMTTDGTVYAKLKADGGGEKTYRVIQREPNMRVRTGKGITAREWSLKLEVVDATRVDLDNVDFVVGASVRRWTR